MKARAALFSIVLIAAVGGGGVYGMQWWKGQKHLISTDNAYVRGNVTVISPRIDGYIEQVHVAPNQPVAAGDLLVTFRADRFETEVDTARADLKAARAEVETGRASVDNMGARRHLQGSLIAQAEARLMAAEAQSELATLEFDRYQALMERDIGSRQKYEHAWSNDRMRRADVKRSEAELDAARAEIPVIDSEIRRIESGIDRLEAMVEHAAARLDRAEIALSDTLVVAPTAGVVGNKKIEPGMYMQAGWPMMALVSLSNVWVEANFKETQIKNLRAGQEVRLHVDTFPDHPVIGRIESLAPASAAQFSLLPSQNVNGNFVKVVQRVPVRIRFEAPPHLAGRLVPGMSVVATVDTKTAPDGAALAANVSH